MTEQDVDPEATEQKAKNSDKASLRRARHAQEIGIDHVKEGREPGSAPAPEKASQTKGPEPQAKEKEASPVTHPSNGHIHGNGHDSAGEHADDQRTTGKIDKSAIRRAAQERPVSIRKPDLGPKGVGDKPRRDKPLTREELKLKLAALDKRYARRETVSEKVLLQSAMRLMRRDHHEDPRAVDMTYPINPPYAFAHVHYDADEGELRYTVKEPTLRAHEQEQLAEIRHRMEAMTDQDELPVVDPASFGDAPEMQDYLREKFLDVIDLYDIDVPKDRRRTLFYYLQRDLVGLGRTDPVVRDPFIEDISCNGTDVPIYVFHRVYGSVRTSVVYPSEMELNKYIMMLAQVSGKHISIHKPILDATLRDGSRINLTLGTEVTKKGSTFTIRKFSEDPISPIDLLRFGSMSSELLAYLWHLIENKRSVLVSGGTASGKTTLLNALGMFMRHEDKIVSIEDTPEVHLAQKNWVQSVSRAGYGGTGEGADAGAIDLFALLVAALRQRPEYIIVGEVRGREASTLFQAISTGHAAMATIHAGSIEELLNRIENEPMNIPRVLFQALDAVVFPGQVLLEGKRARRVVGVTEILGMDGSTGNMLTNDPFRWEAEDDSHRFLGRSFVIEEIARSRGIGLDDAQAELGHKKRFLEMLDAADMNNFHDVTRAVNDYYLDRERVTRELEEKTAGR